MVANLGTAETKTHVTYSPGPCSARDPSAASHGTLVNHTAGGAHFPTLTWPAQCHGDCGRQRSATARKGVLLVEGVAMHNGIFTYTLAGDEWQHSQQAPFL